MVERSGNPLSGSDAEAFAADGWEGASAETLAARSARALAEIAASPALRSGDVATTARMAAEAACRHLGGIRAGVWMMSGDRKQLFLEHSATAEDWTGGDLPQDALALNAAVLPVYMSYVGAGRAIAVADTFTDDRTAELLESYLRPGDIRALIDAPLRVSGETRGILCVEQAGSPRAWQAQEQLFVASLADLLSLALQSRERESMLEEMREARRVAEEANRAKSRFLAVISHELRTPLNAILGFSSLMQHGLHGPLGNPKYEDYCRNVESSAQDLLRIVDSLLDAVRMESGSFKVLHDHVDLPALVREAVADLTRDEPLPERFRLTLPEKPAFCLGDRTRLGEAINALLANAVKFSPSDAPVEITLTLAARAPLASETAAEASVARALCEADSAGDLYSATDLPRPPTLSACLTIRDHGIGMSREQIAEALLPFTQLDGDLNRRFSGLGLGLPMAKRIVELHGGRLGLTPQAEGGLLASVELPAREVPK